LAVLGAISRRSRFHQHRHTINQFVYPYIDRAAVPVKTTRTRLVAQQRFHAD